MVRITKRLPKGTIIGNKYIIEERLSGGEKENDLRYLAFDCEKTKNYVYIREFVFKISKKNGNKKSQEEFIESLVETFNKLTEIKHPNLLPVHHIFSEEEKAFSSHRLFIAIDAEMNKSKTLQEVIESYSGEIPVEKVKEWALQICDGLTALHNIESGPVIYYDLNPENILVTEDGSIKLYDYGCSRILKENFGKNKNMGTPGYSAPEQYGLKPVDKRADIFGLGALMHYLITGKDPRENPLTFETIKSTASSCPRQLSKLISRCVENKVESRIEKIEDVKKRLEKISLESLKSTVSIKMKEKPDLNKEIPAEKSFLQKMKASISWTLSKIWYKYTKQIIGAAALAIITLIALGILSLASSAHNNDEKIMILGKDNSSIVSMNIEKNNLLETIDTDIKPRGTSILSRDGKYIYITSNPDLLYCFSLESNKIVTQIKVGDGPEGMNFSPVQNYLAVTGSTSNTITLIDIDHNNPVATLKSGGETPVALCFSSDGKEIFVVNKESKTIVAMDLTGKILATIDTEGEPLDIINGGFNNKLYATIWDKNEILVLDSDKKEIISRIETSGGPDYMAVSKEGNLFGVACKKSKEVLLISMVTDRIVNKTIFKDIPSSMTFDGNSLYIGTTNFDKSLSNVYLWNTESKDKSKVATSPMKDISGLILY